jgi:hypothetical protein
MGFRQAPTAAPQRAVVEQLLREENPKRWKQKGLGLPADRRQRVRVDGKLTNVILWLI